MKEKKLTVNLCGGLNSVTYPLNFGC